MKASLHDVVAIIVVASAMLMVPAVWAASETCPPHVRGCNPEENTCRLCHHTCLYCQDVGKGPADGVCGPEDCMECLPGYRFVQLFEDGTGECTDRPVIYKATCPKTIPGCSPENQCITCHDSCTYCQVGSFYSRIFAMLLVV
eukprot:m.192872 g.192872  ORF g.192872 m.192872 type:complete len:143 (-) comp16775_c2_seq2:1029-1457(-)